MKKEYIIQGDIDPESDNFLFWNNDMGWVDKSDATRFTKNEIDTLFMPIGFSKVMKG